MMIRPDLDSVVVVVVRGASLGFTVIHLPTAPTIHLPTAPASAPLALAAAPAPAPPGPPGVTSVAELVQDEVSQLQTEDDDSTASTNLSRVRINEIVQSSVPKKKGRLVGLGRRTRSVPPSSAPPPFVDPEVLTAQLKDKDDRISFQLSAMTEETFLVLEA
uniref:Uncharacterized protein n=1 Tax=Brassica oleracea var. oleracea TaxID=109376 RepID=A0A0D3AX79_BRAOL